ncbi:MAG: PilN domain-containing protein [Desulfobacterales bacterium]|jgi:type IV pilus assembly protein PilN|nr:PilN domain-containing protein [Desulfobacterales bacterium]MDP4978176.1 PilN domain-containing protein [Desulfobacterales bacterium]
MIRINLLPFRAARKKENIRRQISVFFLSFFLMLAVLIYYNIHLGGQIKDLKTDVDTTKNEVAKFQKITKQIEEIKQKLAILEKKTEVIRTLETNRFEPVEMLDNMSGKIIANRMWFTSFDDRPQNVQIDGIALDNKTVADFMTRLEGTGLFGSVRLQTIQKHVVKGSGLKKFSITCSKPVPNEPKKDQKKRT